MRSLVTFAASYFLNSLWLIPLLWAAGMLAQRAARALGCEIRHRIWVGILCAAVMLPGLPILFAGGPVAVATASASGSAAIRFGAQATSRSLQTAWRQMVLPEALLHGISGVFAACALWFFLRLLRKVQRTSELVRGAHALTLPVALEEIRREVASRFRVEPILLTSDDVSGPVTVGLRRSVVIFPARFLERMDTEDFRAALSHECAHLRRRDFLKNLGYEWMSVFIAYHPVTWAIKGQIAQTRELVCDRMAVGHSLDARTYARSLLRLAAAVASEPQPSTINAIGILDANVLESRVMELRTERVQVGSSKRLLALSLSAACLLAPCMVGAVAPLFVPGDRAARAAQDGRVYQIGKGVSAPVLTSQADPEFPKSFKKKGGKFSGTCEVALIVDPHGRPQNVHIVRSLEKDFDQKAVEAVKQYRFKPGMRSGQPVPVELFVDVNFQTF